MMSDILKAKKTGGYVRKPGTYEAGRVCAQKDCDTRISTYNSRPTCRLHTPVRFPRVRSQVAQS